MNSTEEWDERLSYLLAAIGARTQIRFAELVGGMGLMPPHAGVLRRLVGHDGSTQQDIADALRVRRGLMVGLVDELESMGLVERRRHPVDRRANAVHLTSAGKRTFRRIQKLVDGLDAELMAAIPTEDRSSFQAHLHLLGIATGVADGVYPTFPDGSLVGGDGQTSHQVGGRSA